MPILEFKGWYGKTVQRNHVSVIRMNCQYVISVEVINILSVTIMISYN